MNIGNSTMNRTLPSIPKDFTICSKKEDKQILPLRYMEGVICVYMRLTSYAFLNVSFSNNVFDDEFVIN